MAELIEEARVKKVAPKPTRDKGQVSLDLPPWLHVWRPKFSHPQWYNAKNWRNFVQKQPFAITCRETIISNYIALDWQIDAKDSEQRDELKDEINYYEEFFKHTGDWSYTEIVEWIGKDLLDIPFGAAAEIGREGNRPEGRVVWIELLDGGTLFPTLNRDFPVGQYVPEAAVNTPIYFPWYMIDRIYISPRTDILRKGWGMAPPEQIYLALALIGRGDEYYAKLLLDNPEVGILDLGDMARKSAEEWMEAFKKDMTGIDGFKIPVLYEHENPINFIPFGKNPNEIMFDKIIAKYDATVAAGYGISLSDVGIQVTSSGGETLAGSIRQERRSRRTGFAKFREKMVQFFNFMLPDDLEYRVIDQDDEQSVAKGRAILSHATGWGQLNELGAFTPNEIRKIIIAEGLTPIPLPEEVPEDELKQFMDLKVDERPGQLGRPIAPSEGGHGEVFPRSLFEKEIDKLVTVEDIRLKRMIRSVLDPIFVLTKDAVESLDRYGEIDAWNDFQDEIVWGQEEIDNASELAITALSNSKKSLAKSMDGDKWWEASVEPSEIAKDLQDLFRTKVMDEKYIKEEIRYVNGEIGIDELVEPEFGEEDFTKFVELVSQSLVEIWEKLPENIQNCVISGTRKALSSQILANDVAKALDTSEIIHDNNLVIYVQKELSKLHRDIIKSFADELSKIINELVQEI